MEYDQLMISGTAVLSLTSQQTNTKLEKMCSKGGRRQSQTKMERL